MTMPTNPRTIAELVECPFCGEGGSLYIEHLEGTVIHPAHCVRCDNCGASTGYTDKDHIAAWNRRATANGAEGLPEAVLVALRELASWPPPSAENGHYAIGLRPEHATIILRAYGEACRGGEDGERRMANALNRIDHWLNRNDAGIDNVFDALENIREEIAAMTTDAGKGEG